MQRAPLLLLLLALNNTSTWGASARAEPAVVASGPSLRGSTEQQAADRLGPLSLLPEYDLNLDLDPARSSFRLREQIRFTNTHAELAADELMLVVYANMAGIKREDGLPAVTLIGGSCPSAAPCTVSAEGQGFIRVKLGSSLAPGESVTVALEMSGEVPVFSDERTGYGAQVMETMASLASREGPRDFGLLASGNGILSMGGFIAVLAPRQGGIWELSQPSQLGDLTSDDVANIGARIRVPKGMRVATPGLVVNRRAVDEKTDELVVEARLVRDFAVVASERFVTREREVQGVKVRVYLTQESAASLEQVLSAACDSLSLFESTFGGFPYTELEVAEAPLVGGVGGVEFSGLVTVARMLLAHGRGTSEDPSALLQQVSGMLGAQSGMLETPTPRETLDMVVAHEVAHQWWHVLVGSDSRHDPFVDEGLAQWSALHFLERRRSPKAAKRARNQLVMSYQMMRMLGERDRAVDRPVETFSTTMAYGALVYGKGPLVYRELRRLVGDAAFNVALRRYVARYSFAKAPRRAFIDLLKTKANAQQVDALADRWLEQANGDRDLGTLGPATKGAPKLDIASLLKGIGGLPDLSALTKRLLGK